MFTLGQGRVIEGWEQGLPGMKAGGVRKLVIPAELGYGDQSRGEIPANSVLIFDVELLSVP
jgi:peptidylprolyl isomerase